MTKKMTSALAGLAALSMIAAACGSDDGAGVRSLTEDTVADGGSASASGSASGSSDGSASASGVAPDAGSSSASGVAPDAPAEPSTAGDGFAAFGPYSPASDVTIHALVVDDICALGGLLPKDAPIDYGAVRELYEVGVNSVKDDGSIRNIAGYARTERDEPIWNDYADHYGDPNWHDSFVMSAIEGTGAFEGEDDLVRRQGIQKGIQNQVMTSWVFHELTAALAKAADGNFDPAKGAPHNWDEGWAFYHGASPDCAPYATADKRGGNFGTGTAVNDALATAWAEGRDALVAGDAAGAQAALDEIQHQIMVTYVQATIRYGHKIDGAVAEGNDQEARIEQVEGWAFYRVVEPFIDEVDAAAAETITALYDISVGAPQAGSGDAIQAAVESVFDGLGIDAAEIGVLAP